MEFNSAYLFKGINKGISHLEEETYILAALNNGQGYAGGYYVDGEVKDNAFISRWPENKFPLKIFIGADYGYLFTPVEIKQLTQVVQNVINRIESVDPECFQFHITPDRFSADIIIKFRRAENALNNHCYPEIGRERQIKNAELIIHISRSQVGSNLSHSRIYLAIMHNMLHALGIYGHSANPGDTSFKEWTPQQQILTQRDIKTLQLLYRCPLGMKKKDLLLLWEDYRKKYLSLPMNAMLEAIISQMENNQFPPLPSSALSSKASEISVKELALQETIQKYISQLRTA